MTDTETFPCIVCGSALLRVTDDAEAQPEDGVMCKTGGNYGSTVYDPMDGSYLAFNICDRCLVVAGENGRLFETRAWRPVVLAGWESMEIGHEKVRDRPYVQWHRGMPTDGDERVLDVSESIPDGVTLLAPVESLLKMMDERRDRASKRAQQP